MNIFRLYAIRLIWNPILSAKLVSNSSFENYVNQNFFQNFLSKVKSETKYVGAQITQVSTVLLQNLFQIIISICDQNIFL